MADDKFPGWHGTTILAVKRGGKVVVAGDGQASVGQTVAYVDAFGETELVYRGVEEVARPVAGKWTPGLVGSGHTGREADDKELGLFIAKRGHSAIEPVGVLRRILLTIGYEPWAELASRRRFGWSVFCFSHSRHCLNCRVRRPPGEVLQ